jgi:hypothetical protein
MIIRALDVNHDWTFGQGKLNYITQTNAVVQDIDTRLRSFLGDCFFDISSGIDWFNLLGEKNKIALELAVRTVILNTENVSGILDSSISVDNNRQITISYSVNTVFTQTLNNTVIVNL